MSERPPKRLASRIATFLRKKLLAGFFALFPLAVTYWVAKRLLAFLDGIIGKYITPGYHVPGLGIVALVLVLIVTGTLVTSYAGRKLFSLYDTALSRIPFARTIYVSVKQFMEALSPGSKTGFQGVVLIEYPRKDVWSLAFLTKDCDRSMNDAVGGNLAYVYLPHTPNPTSGVLLLVPKDQIVNLDMSIEEGVKLLLSGGLIPADHSVKMAG